MLEASVWITTLETSTHLPTTACSHPPTRWQKPIRALLVVDAKLSGHHHLVGADLSGDADEINHGATAAMAAEAMA